MSIATSRTKLIIANLVGTTFELYELAIYGFLAPIIAVNFFPTLDKTSALLNTFGIFFAGFLIRPLGAVFFGHVGDKTGRKKALMLTIVIMSLATFCIGLLPTYHKVGLWAPIFLVIFRGLQGFSFSAEFIGSLIFLLEQAPTHQRGLMASWATLGGNLGSLIAALICCLVTHFLSHDALYSWGWRIPFLLAVPGGLIALYFRLYIQETITFQPLTKELPLSVVMRFYKSSVFLVFCLCGLYMCVSYLIYVFSVTYLTTFKHLPLSIALGINSLGLLAYILLIPYVANLSDKIGRKPLLLTGSMLSALLIYPYYLLLQSSSILVITLAQLGMVIATAFYMSVLPVTIAELVPANIRFTHSGLGYNLAGLCIGGTTPLIATLFMQSHYGYRMICAYFIFWALLVCISTLSSEPGNKYVLSISEAG